MCRPGRTLSTVQKEPSGKAASGQRKPAQTWALGLLRFQVESLECDGAHLTIETSKPGKLPLEFAIAHLSLTGIERGSGDGL